MSFFGASVAPGKPFKSAEDSFLHPSRAAVTGNVGRVTLCVTVGGKPTYALGTGTKPYLRLNPQFHARRRRC